VSGGQDLDGVDQIKDIHAVRLLSRMQYTPHASIIRPASPLPQALSHHDRL
jgi:hypothetical protein